MRNGYHLVLSYFSPHQGTHLMSETYIDILATMRIGFGPQHRLKNWKSLSPRGAQMTKTSNLRRCPSFMLSTKRQGKDEEILSIALTTLCRMTVFPTT